VTTYPQFCALARAAEIVGERWTLLIVRELCLGPKRFSDLRRGLEPVTASVLTERLNSLEARGVVERYDWPGPIPGKVFRLTPDGEALRPVIHELTRWGARFLFPQRPGETFRGEWLRLVFEAYASKSASPHVRSAGPRGW
jgi:DNA-binding HxlR family transcriptional regulator